MKSTQIPWWAQDSGIQVHPPGAFSRRNLRTVAFRCLVALAVAGGLFAAVVGTAQPRTRQEGSDLTSWRQSTDALRGGCGRVFERKATPGVAGVIASVKADGSPNVPDFRTIVPMTGPFWSPPAAPDVRMYTPSSPSIPEPARLLHNMWSGALVVYYTPTAQTADVRALTLIAATRADLNIIVVPWDTERGPLPSERRIAFATWGASQTCQRLVVSALDQFRSAHPQSRAPGYGGVVAPKLMGTTATQTPAR
jgi:Protein of unknown function (DUF3105)